MNTSQIIGFFLVVAAAGITGFAGGLTVGNTTRPRTRPAAPHQDYARWRDLPAGLFWFAVYLAAFSVYIVAAPWVLVTRKLRGLNPIDGSPR